ncbi:MAG TPA: NAD(P)-dependent oxidoreductase [Pseudolabrys sp.]|nr:NAD(P)-dependent oxidoreductase [Pseudolabrys sp.]
MARTVALIGTGIMGAHMARRLAQAGLPTVVWNRDRAKADKLTQYGVTVAATPSAACASADAVIVMLSNGPVVEEVMFAADASGRVPSEAMRKGSALIVMSSIPVETCQAQAKRMEARGVGYIDAPVSGGEPGARDGTLAIMAGGDAALVENLTDVFAPMGRVTRIGPVGTGQMTKLSNQIIVGATMAAVAEAMTFAARGGADPAAWRKALMGGFADSKILNLHGQRMVERNFVPGGPAEYQLKDMRTAQAWAEKNGLKFTLLDCVEDMFSELIERFGTGLDVSAIMREVERSAGGKDATKEGKS